MTDGHYVRAIAQLMLFTNPRETLAFYQRIPGDKMTRKPVDVRRFGTPMSAAQLREANISARAIVSREFYQLLNDAGRADPVNAADALYSMMGKVAGALRDQLNAEQTFGPAAMIQVIPNTTLAGPCPACLELSREPVPLARAPLGPLDGCPHPDQCALLFRSVMPDD